MNLTAIPNEFNRVFSPEQLIKGNIGNRNWVSHG